MAQQVSSPNTREDCATAVLSGDSDEVSVTRGVGYTASVSSLGHCVQGSTIHVGARIKSLRDGYSVPPIYRRGDRGPGRTQSSPRAPRLVAVPQQPRRLVAESVLPHQAPPPPLPTSLGPPPGLESSSGLVLLLPCQRLVLLPQWGLGPPRG